MITTVTLNASIDKAYSMDESIKNGTVMRVASCRNSAGGKGLNVARIVKLSGADVQVTGFVGGFNGQYLEHLLSIDGIANDFIHIEGETRSCINILDTKYGSTEYLEPGCEVSPVEEQEFLDRFSSIISRSNVITISGSIPKGVNLDIYARLIDMIKGLGKQVILDTSGESLILGLQSRPTIVKPNQDEIELLFKAKLSGMSDVITYAKKIHFAGIPYVVISLGGDGALLVCEKGVFHGIPPKVEATNTVGCGDSMVGALAVALEKKYSTEKMLRYAIAIATANAISPKTGYYSQTECEKIFEHVIIEKL